MGVPVMPGRSSKVVKAIVTSREGNRYCGDGGIGDAKVACLRFAKRNRSLLLYAIGLSCYTK